MKQINFLFLAILICIVSCTKQSEYPTETLNTETNNLPKMSSIVPDNLGPKIGTENLGNNTPQPIELQHIGNGVYQAAYSNEAPITIRVRNLTYQISDIFGFPLPATLGYPVYGELADINELNPGATVEQHPNGEGNQFVVAIPTMNNPTSFNASAYHAAATSAFNQWYALVQMFQNNANVPVPPLFPTYPPISDYITSSQGVPNIKLVTGKLIRINWGSTFGLVIPSYTATTTPPPPPINCTTNPNTPLCIYCQSHPNDPNCP